ncbi:uncharacterized protein LOC134541482 isoform X2 [Bacillus rossius redtenbacheri]|uniref:uncharacterized protein LOC134541482 isoform X2 n=1 Tax=Bacillus rossius redtenbacheri TaxID=93214 RepID=UPI002FDE2FEA
MRRLKHLPGHSDGKPCSPQLCLVHAAEVDKVTAGKSVKMATRVWQMSRPPRGFSTPPPVVTARQVQVTRAQLTGKLDPEEDFPLRSVSSILGHAFTATCSSQEGLGMSSGSQATVLSVTVHQHVPSHD